MSGFNWNNATSNTFKIRPWGRPPLPSSSLKYDLNTLLRCHSRPLRVIVSLSAAEKLVPHLDGEEGAADTRVETGRKCRIPSWADNSCTSIHFTATGLGFIHYKVGGSDGIVGINDQFIVIQSLPFLAEHLLGSNKYREFFSIMEHTYRVKALGRCRQCRIVFSKFAAIADNDLV